MKGCAGQGAEGIIVVVWIARVITEIRGRSVMENFWCHVIQHVASDRFHPGKCLKTKKKNAACFSFSLKSFMCVSGNFFQMNCSKTRSYLFTLHQYKFHQWQYRCWLFSINLVTVCYWNITEEEQFVSFEWYSSFQASCKFPTSGPSSYTAFYEFFLSSSRLFSSSTQRS